MKRKNAVWKSVSFLLVVALLSSTASIILYASDDISDVYTTTQEESAPPEGTAEGIMADGTFVGVHTSEAGANKETGVPDEQSESEGENTSTAPPMREAEDFAYDPQPETIADVQSAIEVWQAGEAAKPRWESQADDSLMPSGWRCDYLEDEETGLVYWTFFPVPVAMSLADMTAANYDQLLNAISNAPDDGVSTGTEYVIEITDDITFSGTLLIDSGKNIVIRSNSMAPDTPFKLSKSSGAWKRHFIVSGFLTLENITIDRRLGNDGGIEIDGSGKLTMNAGSTIERCSGSPGGGVYVGGTGELVMNQDSAIRGCSSSGIGSPGGGGVYMGASTVFTMNGGEITDNSVTSYGGGISAADNTLITIKSGSISNNMIRATPDYYSGGGGIYTSGKLIFEDGIISENVLMQIKPYPSGLCGAGVYAREMEMYGGEISHNRLTGNATFSQGGGGVYIGSSMYMEGGDISYNIVEAVGIFGEVGKCAPGGGIYGGNITIVGGAIHHNDVGVATDGSRGGGIAVDMGNQLILSGGEIYENTATWGGGVYLNAYAGGDNSIITGDTEIYGNKACYGGGITVHNNVPGATMEPEISGAVKIYENVASTEFGVAGDTYSYGGGVFFYATLGTASYDGRPLVNATIKDNVEISGNTATNYGGGIAIRGSANTGNNSATDILGALTISDDVTVCNNESDTGGGIFVCNSSLLLCDRVEVSGNVATGTAGGGGIRHSAGTYDTVELTDHVRITGNTAEYGHGGGIYTSNLARLFAGADVTFENNKASAGNYWTLDESAVAGDESLSAIHMSNIAATRFTAPFTNAYNNFDVSNTSGSPVYTVTFYDDDGTPLVSFAVDRTDGKTVLFSYPEELTSITKPVDPVKAPTAQYAYEFEQWNPHGDYTVEDINTPIEQNMEFTASYTKTLLYNFTVRAEAGGSVDTTINGSYAPGEVIPITATPNSKYIFSGWTSDNGGVFADSTSETTTFTMPEANVTVTAEFKSEGGNGGGGGSGSGSASGGGDTTIPKDEDDESILNSKDHFAYIIGYSDGTVRPNENITREEAATIFFRLLTDETQSEYWSAGNNYNDVDSNRWSNSAISTLTNAGILTGYPDGSFRPAGSITRAEFAAVAARFSHQSYSGGNRFTDIEGHWAAEAINLAAELGYVEGYPDGTFRPDEAITRAEVMTLINRVLERQVESAEDLHEGMIKWPDNSDQDAWYYLAVQEATNSHWYEKKGSGVYEIWTGLRDDLD